MNDELARAADLLGGSMPALHGRLRLTGLATDASIAALDPHERRIAEALRREPRTAIELLGEAGWSVDAAGALSRLQDKGLLAVEPLVPRGAVVLVAFLVLAFAGALVVVLSLPSFWRGQPVPAFVGLGVLLVASGGALATAMKKS